MDLQSPTTLLSAWILGPLLTVAAAAGLGAGLARLAGVRLGALVVPLGYLAGVVAMSGLLRIGVGGRLTVAIVALAALAGAFGPLRDLARKHGRSIWPRRRGWLPPALAGLAAFALAMAPVAGSGRSGVSGYVLNNDPAVHATLVEWIADHGTGRPDPAFASSVTQIGHLPASGYPIGSHVWPLFQSTLTATDVIHIWAPAIAIAAAMLALLAFAVLLRLGANRWFAAAAGALVPAGYLFFSFIAQGGAKEVLTAVAVYGTVVLGTELLGRERRAQALPLLLVAPTAAFFTFGAGSAAWLAPPAAALVLFALWRFRRLRPNRAVIIAGTGVLALLAVLARPLVRDAVDYVDSADATMRDPAQVGNLLGPVPVREAFNLWFAYDYRVQPPNWETLSTVGPWLAATLVALGLLFAVLRRDVALPLIVASGVAAALIISNRYSIYLDTKSYAILAPALGIASAAGVVALLHGPRLLRLVGAGTAAVVGAGVLAGASLVYAGAWITPQDRFEELGEIADRFQGDGPILVNEREAWAYYLLRDLDPVESWGAWQADRGLVIGRVPPPLPHNPDFDDYTLEHIDRFTLLLDRKGPAGSRPPVNYEAVHETAHYRVWQRAGPRPELHVGLGRDTLGNAAELDCSNPEVRAAFARAEETDRPIVASVPGAQPQTVADPSDWRAYETRAEYPPEGMINRREGFAAALPELEPGGYDAWIQGSFGPGVRLLVEGRSQDAAFGDLGLPSAWHHLGRVTIPSRSSDVALVATSKPAWQSGSRRSDLTGSLVVQATAPQPRIERVPATEAERLCGRWLDWIEVPAG